MPFDFAQGILSLSKDAEMQTTAGTQPGRPFGRPGS
jgi:hypothetical protein